jgi:quercetin dioxygenase-like cupin family protein
VLVACIAAMLIAEQGGSATQARSGKEGQYGKYFFYDARPMQLPREAAAKMKKEPRQPSTVEATRLVDLDTRRSEGAPYLDFVWLWKGSAQGYAETEHVHDFDEFIGFIGTAGRSNPQDLGGEMEVWLGGEKYSITKSCLIYVPKGLKHCPIRFVRIDTPILFFTGGMATKYSRTATVFDRSKESERNYAKYISYGVNPKKNSPEAQKRSAEMRVKSGSTLESTRLLDLDNVEGAPYIDFSWMWKGSEKTATHLEHQHDWGEIFGYVGSRGQKDPHGLGGEVEFWLGGEKHIINQSCLIWIPPNLKHCPEKFDRIDSPILWFTIGMTRKYTMTPTKTAAGN